MYASAPCFPQPPPVFNNYRQLQPLQYTPRPECLESRGLQSQNEAPPLNFHGVPPLVDTFAQPFPIANDQQQPLAQQSERRTYVSGAVLPTEGGAQQLLAPVRLNGALFDGTLIDSGSSLSMVSASTLAALPVPPSVEPYTSRHPYIVDIGGPPLHVLGDVVAAVAVSDVEVTHRLVVIRELAFPLLIGNDILRSHRAIIELGPPDVLQLGVDRCPVCVDARVPVALQRDAAAAVTTVSSDTTLPTDVASRVPVSLPPQVVDDSTSFVKPLPSELVSTSCAVSLAVCAPTEAACVQSVANASTNPVDICAVSPIAAVSSVTPPQPSPPAFGKQAFDSLRDARRPRRPRGRHRAPQLCEAPTSNAVRRCCSPSTKACYRRVWTPLTAPVTPYSGFVT